jgi:colanic acid/amylovoran biosynthesis glycosyltransferase
MRICVLTETYPTTTQTFIYEPIEWLRGAGHEVSVVATRRGEVPGASPDAHPATLIPAWLSWRQKIGRFAANPGRMLRMLPRSWQWRGTEGWSVLELAARGSLTAVTSADCVLAHFGPHGSRWLPVVGTAKRPYAVYFHGFDATSYVRKSSTAYAGLIGSGAGLITNSRYLQSLLLNLGAKEDQVGIVPYASSADLASVTNGPALESRRLLTIARLVPKKGLDDSLRAFARAQSSLCGAWRYQLVGDGPLLEDLKGLVNSLGISHLVEFSGFLSRQDTLAALRKASLFVLASKTAASGDTEGTPVSILEAAGVGLPVISTVHAGIQEILPAEARNRGYLVSEGDIAALAAAMVDLGGSLQRRREWGEACRTFHHARHSPHMYVTGLIEALKRLAKPPVRK